MYLFINKHFLATELHYPLMEQFVKTQTRLLRMESLIAKKATGTPQEFAAKLGMTQATLFRYLKLLKETYKAPIEFCHQVSSYKYTDPAFHLNLNEWPVTVN